MFENNNELFSLYLNGEFQGYVNSDDYHQIAAAIRVFGMQGDLIITSFIDTMVISTIGIFLDYCLPEIRQPLMQELVPMQQSPETPELVLFGKIQFYAQDYETIEEFAEFLLERVKDTPNYPDGLIQGVIYGVVIPVGMESTKESTKESIIEDLNEQLTISN
ncbi:hypothetical protein BWGOE4_09590 [Bacillus mycoides]|uniref:Uncharacterized protein n=1 Tax=Bacillus mycoides TaxID=1405 RepID=A0A1E8BEZ1_BACMY|nr:hypothetical protein [Bacillus mycoides]MBJ8073218.1 hypothetical protein [Bacillus cereus]MBJ8189347.1 hypothetical protein [Bacillus cereus]OFD35845.1 hypothetical protein BWGOE1_57100 [Bacillus mycoides]OFD36089.1 hypothetical protein BWGOE2_56020 [Bacillus mycoides]OFD57382.1 hypothetical protein BWGOE7_55830 [Bacillus mycoides]